MSELFTFGTLSYFYNDLITADQKAIATEAFGLNYKVVKSWLRCCTDLRNICAHYGRLYYRIFSAVPADLEDKCTKGQKCRLFGALMMLKEFYPFKEKWNKEFLKELESLIEEYKNDIDLYHIAFPKDWKQRLQTEI